VVHALCQWIHMRKGHVARHNCRPNGKQEPFYKGDLLCMWKHHPHVAEWIIKLLVLK
jgi:hypothetical protein